MEKMVDCTCIYVLNASSKGSGETAKMRRLGAFVAHIGNKKQSIVHLCLLNIHVHVYTFGDPTLLILYNSRFTLTSQTTGNKHCRYKEG